MSASSRGGVKLGAKWQLDAAMLSRPVDLTALVTMSQSDPEAFFEDDVPHLLVSKLLNSSNTSFSDKDTKLDVLTILGNLAALSEKRYKEDVKTVLQGVSKWFDDYLYEQEVQPNSDEAENSSRRSLTKTEPELHKAMFVLVARSYEYSLRTEDLLELTGGNRALALEVIVSLLEEGETYTTELTQRQAPGSGAGPAQWEHQLVCMRHERPLILQMCRLLRGFTHPSTYFTGKRRLSESKSDEFDVLDFSREMNNLLEITLRTELVEKLSIALHDCLYEDSAAEANDQGDDPYGSLLCESDHLAVAAIHEFLQNLYHYAAKDMATFRTHILTETLLIPRLILPYLDRCAAHAELLCERAAESARNLTSGDNEFDSESVREVTSLALEYPALARGIASSLRTLVIASFRAPPTRFVLGLLRRLNPTSSLLRASAFVAHHDYLLALVCLVNVNMGALDMSSTDRASDRDRKADSKGDDEDGGGPYLGDDGEGIAEAYYARMLLLQLRNAVSLLDDDHRRRVVQRLQSSSALPVMRDTPSFAAIQVMLMSQEELLSEAKTDAMDEAEQDGAVNFGETMHFREIRSEAKAAAVARLSERKSKEVEQPPQSPQRVEKGGKFRLLGDLPPLEQRRAREMVNVELALPEFDENRPKLNIRQVKKKKNRKAKTHKREEEESSSKLGEDPLSASIAEETQAADNSIPAEFACRINGHLMKDPVRTPSGIVFERDTIVLWLQTRGSICPITGDPLTVEELREDPELRQGIMRWQISNLLTYNAETDPGAGDGYADVYDF